MPHRIRPSVPNALALLALLPACYESSWSLSGDPPIVEYSVPRGDPSVAVRYDLLVLVDNSGSMAEEQAALVVRFPDLLTDLLDPPDLNADGVPDHPAVGDLNVGIISTDMGTMGYRVTTCADSAAGDDGCLQHERSPLLADCSDTYPRFLSESGDSYDPTQAAADFGCIATLGTQGCGFEQHFKALRKALKENTQAGQCNEGFLRDDSFLGVLILTDEDDCSVDPAHPEMFDPDLTATLGHLNIRCFLHQELVQTVEWYYNELASLRPWRPSPIAVGMIVGVPPEATACIGSGVELTGCLAHPAMVPTLDPLDATQLVPSCNTAMGYAYPPVRFIQLAQRLGRSAYVGSICTSDWTGPMRALTDPLGGLPEGACLEGEVPFSEEGCTAECDLIETLADDRACEADVSCPASGCDPVTLEDLAWGEAPACRAPDGSTCRPLKRDLGLGAGAGGATVRRCLVRQAVRVWEPSAERCALPDEEGWYYLPAAWNDEQPGCARARLLTRDESGFLTAADSTATLRCRVSR